MCNRPLLSCIDQNHRDVDTYRFDAFNMMTGHDRDTVPLELLLCISE